MPNMHIILNGDGAFADLAGRNVVRVDDSKAITVAALDGGMSSGLPSVAFKFELPDGRAVIAETSARLFCSAAKAIMAKYPDLFVDQEGGGT